MKLATPEDIEEILRMAEAFVHVLDLGIEFDELSCAKTALALMNDPNSIILVADGAMIGGGIYPHFFNHNETMAKEFMWWCDPSKRGTGIAKRLWEAFEVWAKERGAKHISMFSPADTKSIAKLYGRRGYRLLETAWVKSWA